MEKFSIADAAEYRARQLGPFASPEEEQESARAFDQEQDSFNRTDRMIHNARVRLSADAKRTAEHLRKTYGLGS